MRLRALLLALLPLLGSCEREPEYDLLVRGGTVYDGTGSAGFAGEVAIQGDRIAFVGPKAPGRGAARNRRHRPGGRARFHQHAVAGRRSRSWSMAADRASCGRE